MEYQPALEPFEEPDLFSEDAQTDSTVEAVDEEPDPLDPEEILGDLYDLARDRFEVWWLGSELNWAAYVFEILKRAGLADLEPEIERTRTVIRLMVLAAVNQEFANRTGEHTDWTDGAGGWTGEFPLVDPFNLGLLCGELGVGWENDPHFNETPAVDPEICQTVMRALHREVVDALLEELGENILFASLWCARFDDTQYPLSAEAYHGAVNEDVTGEKADGYQWVSDGLPL